MSQAGINPDDIRRIAEAIAGQIMARGGGSSAPAHAAAPAPTGAAAPAPAGLGDGVFASIDEAAGAAWAAFLALSAIGLDKRRAIIESMRRAMRAQAEALARLAVDETGTPAVAGRVRGIDGRVRPGGGPRRRGARGCRP